MDQVEKNKWQVGGFSFTSERDAELARKEEDRVAYLEKRMRYDHPEVVLAVFNKAVDGRIFSTPIGLQYLRKVRAYLEEKGLADQARAIPIYQEISYDPAEKIRRREVRQRVEQSTYSSLKGKLFASVVINVLLLVAVIAMFIIAMTSDNPNIINYKRALENHYASWEMDLKDREDAIRQKERELNIPSPPVSVGAGPIVVE